MLHVIRPRRLSRQDMYVRPLLPALLVFIALMTIIGLSWRTARHDIVAQRENTVSEDASFIESTLKQRFSIYEGTLRAANGLFLGSDSVSREEWSNFIQSLNLEKRYPGIRSVGYIKVLTNEEKEGFLGNMRANDLPTFTIHPERDAVTYAPLVYSVPTAGQITNDRTSAVIGYDMYDDPLRRSTMDVAAASGEPTFTSILNFVQTSNAVTKGFMLFMPHYKKNMPVATIIERQQALDGYFYAPFALGSVFDNVFNISQPAFAFSIYDGDTQDSNRLYESSAAYQRSSFREVRRTALSLYDRQWTIVYKAGVAIVPTSVNERPVNLLIGGSIFSAALAIIIYLLIQRRTRSLAYSEQKRLEDAKDDLLSLASHQLRTPATAVKQYVSMLRDGFAGKLTKDQRSLLRMAYESNERQLTIVDDLLYVARIDSGQTALRLEQVNLSELLRSVIADQRSIIKSRKQIITLKLPRNDAKIEADPQYLRMIVENLLSNASKYSHERKKINLELQSLKHEVLLSITDHGVGIAPENFPDMFVRFSRIPNELSRQIAGSGIGLYLAKQLAVLHNGDITFTSVQHRGTTFALQLPKRQPQE